MKFKTQLAIVAGIFVVAGILLARGGTPALAPTTDASNVRIENGQQIVTIKAKGGYAPTTSEVKAGMPTTIRFETNATFDCSSSVRIPSLGISQNLPANGSTDIALGQLAAGTLQGTCGMGMYQFSIHAKS